jgi:xanthine dehydrogenase accessory factor
MTPGARRFADKVAALGREGHVFAVATVVGRRAPVSAHLGDRAIVYADGRMEGFVGGACSREIARKQALEAIRTRHARLVSIRPDASANDSSDPEHVIVPMRCVSEGAIDLYIEPFVPARRVVVVGATPVADAVARLAAALDFDAVRIVESEEMRDIEAVTEGADVRVRSLESLADAVTADGADVAVVVATQGHYDEEALQIAVTHEVPYVGLVASRKRAASVRDVLEARGVSNLAGIRNPAGLDLGARTPAEVALSILAEIVRERPAGTVSRTLPAGAAVQPVPAADAGPASTAVDPVCGMDVEVAGSKHAADVEGRRYYFCCAQCRERFVADPGPFLTAS